MRVGLFLSRAADHEYYELQHRITFVEGFKKIRVYLKKTDAEILAMFGVKEKYAENFFKGNYDYNMRQMGILSAELAKIGEDNNGMVGFSQGME